MDLDDLRARCLAKAGVTAEYPFGPGALVMKVSGRIFAIIGDDARPVTVSLKCEPEVARVLRDMYTAVVVPGYHLNKQHWNTVTIDGTVPDEELAAWIDDSYDLVVDKLPRHAQLRLGWDV